MVGGDDYSFKVVAEIVQGKIHRGAPVAVVDGATGAKNDNRFTRAAHRFWPEREARTREGLGSLGAHHKNGHSADFFSSFLL